MDMAKTGVVCSAHEYSVGAAEVDVGKADGGSGGEMDMVMNMDVDGLLPPPAVNVKGKGKEKEVDGKIVDITNSALSIVCFRRMPNNTLLLYGIIDTQSAPKAIDTSLERITSILEESPLEEESLFGQPNNSLGPPTKRRRLSIATPPPPTSRSTSAGSSSSGPSRRPTVAEIEVDMLETRIPSSTSPSPMKMLKSRDGSRGSMGPGGPSPAKVSSEVTKALQESITSLLGKRQNSEEDANPNIGHPVAKAGKRIRPQPKSKVLDSALFYVLFPADLRLQTQSRQQSGEYVAPPSLVIRPPASRSLSPFEANDELNLLDGGGMSYEESMRVRYEDPGERDERKRLMSLFESQTPDGERLGKKMGRKGPGLVRRSTRMAGF